MKPKSHTRFKMSGVNQTKAIVSVQRAGQWPALHKAGLEDTKRYNMTGGNMYTKCTLRLKAIVVLLTLVCIQAGVAAVVPSGAPASQKDLTGGAGTPPGTRAEADLSTEGLVLDLVPIGMEPGGVVDQGPIRMAAEILGGVKPVPGGLEFDGRTGWIRLPPAAELDLRGDLTIEAAVVVHPETLAGGYHMIVWRGDEQGGHDPYTFSIVKGQLIFRRDFPKTFQVAWPLGDLDPNQPHVFCAVHRSYEQILELWVDGRKVGRTLADADFRYKTAGMATQIGAMADGQSQRFIGVMKRVRIFRRPLSPEEIAAESSALLGR